MRNRLALPRAATVILFDWSGTVVLDALRACRPQRRSEPAFC